MKGKIVLVPFPFTDLKGAKLRPALVIFEGERDVILAFISSQIPSKISITDVMVTRNRSGFAKAGLKADSVVKLDKVATVLKNLIVGELGELDEDLKQEVNQKLRRIMKI